MDNLMVRKTSTLPSKILIGMGFLLMSSMASGKELDNLSDHIQTLLGLENVSKISPIVFEDVRGIGIKEAIVFVETKYKDDHPSGKCIVAVLDPDLENVHWQKTAGCWGLDFDHAGLNPLIRLGPKNDQTTILTFSYCWNASMGCMLELMVWKDSGFVVVGKISERYSEVSLMTMPDGEAVIISKGRDYGEPIPKIYEFDDGLIAYGSNHYPNFFEEYAQKASDILAAIKVDNSDGVRVAIRYLPVFRATDNLDEGMKYAEQLLLLNDEYRAGNPRLSSRNDDVARRIFGFMADLHMDRGLEKAAFDLYLKSAQAYGHEPINGSAGAHNELGGYYYRNGQYEEAIREFEKAKELLVQSNLAEAYPRTMDSIDHMIKLSREPVRNLY